MSDKNTKTYLASRPNVATISPDQPFLPTLIKALFDGNLVKGFTCTSSQLKANPFHLADLTLYLPTRRAVREAENAFLNHIDEEFGRPAALLPTIRAIGDIDESDLILSESVLQPEDLVANLPPAVPELERILVLSQLIWAWSKNMRTALRDIQGLSAQEQIVIPASLADSARLATDLATLLDEAETHGIDWTRLSTLVPDNYARYWQLSLSFLEIVTKAWPSYLKERGLMGAMARRNRLIAAKAAHLRKSMPIRPIIAAGSTGSIPATADFLAAIAHLPQGAVVLPGLDMELAEHVFQTIGQSTPLGSDAGSADDPSLLGHPQTALKDTLLRIGTDRNGVDRLETETAWATPNRFRILNEALRPVEATADWAKLPLDQVDKALSGLAIAEARNPEEEAQAIALSLRAKLEEEPTALCALVTPDRGLAERVSVTLTRLGISTNDSAGQNLFQTPAGRLARLSVDVALGDCSSVALLALLKHPMTGLSDKRAHIRNSARALERALLRGPSVAGTLDDKKAELVRIRAAIHHEAPEHRQRPTQAQRQLDLADWQAADALINAVASIFSPFETLLAKTSEPAPLSDFVEAHLTVLKALTAGTDTAPLFADSEDGKALIDALNNLQETGADFFLSGSDYGPLLTAIIGQRPVRYRRHLADQEPRVQILGTLEARLIHADFLVLGSLNEKSWPADPGINPFLSRSMRNGLGLPAVERALGLSAHDFVQLASKPHVLLTRSLMVDGAPTQPARWLQRLGALVGDTQMDQAREGGQYWLHLARAMDRPENAAGCPTDRPAPKPSVALRPKQLSVTEIETLIRDPYAIYARHVLKLHPFEGLDENPSFATRGMIVHDILHRFVECQSAEKFTFDSAEASHALTTIADTAFEPLAAFPDIYASWRSRFNRIGKWFLAQENLRQTTPPKRHVEVFGRLSLDSLGFVLTGRADRIDISPDGLASIIDYKTGTPPSKDMVKAHLAPQLSLEAAILAAGGFGDLPPTQSNALSYVQLSGATPPGRIHTALSGKDDVMALAEQALGHLQRLINHYNRDDVAYLSQLQPMKTSYEGDYDHLARVAEWRGFADENPAS